MDFVWKSQKAKPGTLGAAHANAGERRRLGKGFHDRGGGRLGKGGEKTVRSQGLPKKVGEARLQAIRPCYRSSEKGRQGKGGWKRLFLSSDRCSALYFQYSKKMRRFGRAGERARADNAPEYKETLQSIFSVEVTKRTKTEKQRVPKHANCPIAAEQTRCNQRRHGRLTKLGVGD